MVVLNDVFCTILDLLIYFCNIAPQVYNFIEGKMYKKRNLFVGRFMIIVGTLKLICWQLNKNTELANIKNNSGVIYI